MITKQWDMSPTLQETVTGSTLNGRKEYLKAGEGDKDKWEFLNFADAWTPSEKVLPLQGNAGNLKDDVFFTHVSPMEWRFVWIWAYDLIYFESRSCPPSYQFLTK